MDALGFPFLSDPRQRATIGPMTAASRPVLLVHGAWHGAWIWADLVTRLAAAGVPAHAIDLPGHGASPQPLGDLNTDADAVAQLVSINQWYAERFADLLDRLAGLEAGDGSSVLDHSAVLWCNELGNGYIHEAADVPYVLAGRCGGAIDPGRYLQFEGRGHGELFAGIGQALGLETEIFGMPEVFGTAMTEILS